MIAAVHTESNALDSMRDKLKELDAMKNQISNLTKRLLEADQANITCKGNLVKLQEQLNDAKKVKLEVRCIHVSSILTTDCIFSGHSSLRPRSFLHEQSSSERKRHSAKKDWDESQPNKKSLS